MKCFDNAVGRRDFLRLSAAAAMSFILPGCGPAKAGRRDATEGLNIVFILADDLGWTDIGCYGRKEWNTPNIDRLAATGMRFTQAYAAAPVCSPTRASILTGKYPAQLHMTDWIPSKSYPNAKMRTPDFRMELPEEETTIAEALQAKGYATCVIGKWHVNDSSKQKPKDSAARHGFKDVIMTDEGPRFIGPGRRPTDDVKTDEALRWLEKNRRKPFFLLFSTNGVHAPIEATPDLLKKHIDRGLDKAEAAYAGMVDALDQNVGRILGKLDELNLADDTAVIFFSDNGGKSTFTSNRPLRGGKGALYEGGIRVPMIVRWPGVTKAGARCDFPVISTDFYSLMAAIAASQAEPQRRLDGFLAPVCRGGQHPGRECLFWHYPHYNGITQPVSAVRMGDWKLIEFLEDGRVELYNIRDDIGETRDLAEKEPVRSDDLRRRLAQWRLSVAAQMPTPNPDYDPALSKKKKRNRPKTHMRTAGSPE
jgi:arylsulfatase A